MNEFVEHLIVGSGPGATVYAKNFSNLKLDYLVFEKSRFYLQADIVPYSDVDLKLRYKNQGVTASVGNVIINYAEGSSVGGGSEVNSGLYHRIPKILVEYWSKLLGRDLVEEGLNESEKFIETWLNVTPVDELNKLAERLVIGSRRLGWDCISVPRWIKGGVKQSMVEIFYRDNLANLRFGCDVVNFKKTKEDLFLVSYMHEGQLKYIRCKYLFLGAGSISSPMILQNSYRGRLFSKVDGLMMHPSVKIIADFGESILEREEVPNVQVKEFSPEFSLGCSISTEPYVGLFLSSMGKLNDLDYFDRMGIYYAMISTNTMGSIIRLPYTDPIVRYDLSEDDFGVMRRALIKLGMVLFEGGAKRIMLGAKGTDWHESFEEFESNVSKLRMSSCDFMTIHLFGSLGLSRDSGDFGFNAFGESRAFSNLYVCDSSMLPTSPTVNPQGPLMVLADLNCKFFLRNRNYVV